MVKFCIIFLYVILNIFFINEKPASGLSLSLKESILLAVRKNPNVQVAQLQHTLQKFSLEIQQWQFQPHYSLQAHKDTTSMYSVNELGYVTHNKTGIDPTATLLTPIGTRITLASSNNISKHYNPALSLQVVQPLLRGFGRPIVEAELYNALDSEKISVLQIEGLLRNTITEVINAYLDAILAQYTLDIDKDGLKRIRTSIKQTDLFIKAGRKAAVELVAAEAEAAHMQSKIETDENKVLQARYALLTAIGIDPHTQVSLSGLNITNLINQYPVISLHQAIKLSLNNDIQYRIDQITLQGMTKRNLLAAQDRARWKLDLSLNASTGGGNGGGQNAGVNSLVNGINQTNSATLNLTVPIDDREAKYAIQSAKIALRQANIALEQEKWSKQTDVINNWHNIESVKRTLKFAENAEKLQQQTYQISLQKYSFGIIDSLALRSSQQELIAAQQELLLTKIQYLKELVNLDQLLGITLKTWDVLVRDS